MLRLRTACEEASPCLLSPEDRVELPVDHQPAEQGPLHRIDQPDGFVVGENLLAELFLSAVTAQALQVGTDQRRAIMNGDPAKNMVALAKRGGRCRMEAEQSLQQVDIVSTVNGAGRDPGESWSAMQAFMRRIDRPAKRMPCRVAKVSAGLRGNLRFLAARILQIE